MRFKRNCVTRILLLYRGAQLTCAELRTKLSSGMISSAMDVGTPVSENRGTLKKIGEPCSTLKSRLECSIGPSSCHSTSEKLRGTQAEARSDLRFCLAEEVARAPLMWFAA